MTALVLAGAAALALVTTAGTGDGENKKFWVQLDNAFGLTDGADVKVGGVKAGKITGFKVDRKARKALVGIEITQEGFDSFRTDVFCETRPQSLIGEYFIDCQPGKSRKALEDGATIPVEQTATTIPPDLVNNVLRLPFRERLRLILMELGIGVASRAEDINEAIRRAVPALRETDRVLAILANQNRVLSGLLRNGDTVLTALNERRDDVGRFITEANDTAEASAARQEDLAATFRNFPGFLRELRPTMTELGRVADEQTPALRSLTAAAPQLERFLGNLGPFSEASRPAVGTLGEASVTGTRAVRAAGPTVDLLDRFSRDTPELAKNLAIVLEHLDDRDHAVENDPDSPGGRGYTGLEALLQYVYDQSLAINIFDQNGYLLKASLFFSEECSPYADAHRVKEHPEIYADCAGLIGPNQPGVTTPDVGSQPLGGSGEPPLRDPDAADDQQPPRAGERDADRGAETPVSRRDRDRDGGRGGGGGSGDRAGPGGGGRDERAPRRRRPRTDEEIAQVVRDVVAGRLPPSALPPEVQSLLPGVGNGQAGGRQGTPGATQDVLDYLLGQ